jgi:soluble lytic murein transglycosylase-like protein
MTRWMLAIALSVFSVISSANNLYIYQAPNGEKVVTDQRVNLSGYRLLHFSGSASETGQVLRGVQTNKTELDQMIENAAELYGVDKDLIRAVIRVESNFNPAAKSHKGAIGLMQLMPATAQQYQATDLYDPETNIHAGTKHLRYLLSLFNNRVNLALAAYNAGEHRVKQYRGIPPYRETQTYVSKVMYHWQQYR